MIEEYDYLIVGAGFAGAVMAERLASDNKKVLVIDKRDHIGGNCFDYNDNGILVQKYGPHVFHTKSKEVFDYLSKFTPWIDYKHKVIAFFKGNYYPIPINLTTVNKFYNLHLKNEKELNSFLDSKKIFVEKITNSRDVVISKFGEELYEAFVKYYTKAQWGKFPEELDRSVLERLPIKYNNNDYYFNELYEQMPLFGFTYLFNNLLKHPNITLKLGLNFFDIQNKIKYKKLIYTGRLDEFFNFKFGKLDYISLEFNFEKLNVADFQPNSVVNHTDKDAIFFRVTELKKFYNFKCNHTILCKERRSEIGEPSYPLLNETNLSLLEQYNNETLKCKNVIFIGRLAQFKYYNMDQIVQECLNLFKKL
ncbi:UDP-galactopyranose mutase [archaeon]|nr:UDP-galactopyranose mutase [archaeon]